MPSSATWAAAQRKYGNGVAPGYSPSPKHSHQRLCRFHLERGLGVYSHGLLALPPMLSSLSTALVLGLGGLRVLQGGLGIGSLLAFQALLGGFTAPFQNLL